MIRKKPRQVLTHIQEKRLRKVLGTMGFLFLAWILFAPNMGYLALKEKSGQIARLEAQKSEMQTKNASLQSQIDRWKNDPGYVEKMARDKYGLVKKEEVLVEFKYKR